MRDKEKPIKRWPILTEFAAKGPNFQCSDRFYMPKSKIRLISLFPIFVFGILKGKQCHEDYYK